MNTLSKDFEDFLALLQKHEVKFLVCGGHAVGFYGYPRLTMDFDLLIYPAKANAEKIMKALNEFGFGKSGITKDLFVKAGTAVTLGAQPNQIDLLTSVSRVSTKKIFENAKPGQLGKFNVLYISKADLIACKKAAGRRKDLADIEELEKLSENQ
ncbi:MAG: nucleotidyltransferase [Victivallaceae bacterium]|nr:nucleotidyltransferase [Victivallaceae bacterium]